MTDSTSKLYVSNLKDTAAAKKNPVLIGKKISLSLKSAAGEIKILRGIDLEIFPGEIVAVTGPSGSGKSSLLAVAAGLEPATGGTISLLDQELTKLNEDDLARLRRGRVGVVFQSFHLLPNQTALENVAAGLELAGENDASRAREKARAALAMVGLEDRADHFPRQLSGGEQQRVAVARAAVIEPDIIFADEPTGNLDQRTGSSVKETLFEMARAQGAALFLVTHDQNLAGQCDRIITLEDGKVVI